MYCGAFCTATGTGEASMTRPKKRTSSASAIGRVGGGWRITQDAPRSAAARTNPAWISGVSPNTVIATGTRSPTSSTTHSITCQRSAAESLATSVASPSAATPWAPPATQASTCRRMASRSSRPARSKKA
jgi:hypothetical protein